VEEEHSSIPGRTLGGEENMPSGIGMWVITHILWHRRRRRRRLLLLLCLPPFLLLPAWLRLLVTTIPSRLEMPSPRSPPPLAPPALDPKP